MPQVYFPPSNKTQARIINVDEFKQHILDNIKNSNSMNNINIDDDSFEELPDSNFSYYENSDYSIVNTDTFDQIVNTLKIKLDAELNTYIQTGSTQIKCKSDMSDCPTYIWKPSIIQIRLNDEYYEYTFQLTYYIQKKAYAYVIICKCYVSRNNIDNIDNTDNKQNINTQHIKLYIDELDLMGLDHEQNIMLTPGYTQSQVKQHVNIF